MLRFLIIYSFFSEARKSDSCDELSPFLMLLPGVTPLILAIQHRRSAVIRFLLVHDADPSKAASNGVTPLYTAAAQGSLYP